MHPAMIHEEADPATFHATCFARRIHHVLKLPINQPTIHEQTDPIAFHAIYIARQIHDFLSCP